MGGRRRFDLKIDIPAEYIPEPDSAQKSNDLTDENDLRWTEYNLHGAFFRYLVSIQVDVKGLNEYVETKIAAGTISSSLIAQGIATSTNPEDPIIKYIIISELYDQQLSSTQ